MDIKPADILPISKLSEEFDMKKMSKFLTFKKSAGKLRNQKEFEGHVGIWDVI